MRWLVPGIAIALVAAGCAVGTAVSPSVDRVELTIFGAASLKGALEVAKSAYEAGAPGTTLTLSTDSSSTLATQIEQGAPADVFLAADTSQPARLVEGGYASGDAVAFATNSLSIIVPPENPGGIRTPADLARPGVRIIAAGDEVPITAYARQLVANLATEPGYPGDFVAAYDRNVASREDNVKAIVAKIELGEGDAGIVYVTDARASTRVKAVTVPDVANVSATYAGVVVNASPNQAAAKAFLDWVADPDGQSILASFGFGPPSQILLPGIDTKVDRTGPPGA
jgi:molybdate transport system substrate-binding protein